MLSPALIPETETDVFLTPVELNVAETSVNPWRVSVTAPFATGVPVNTPTSAHVIVAAAVVTLQTTFTVVGTVAPATPTLRA